MVGFCDNTTTVKGWTKDRVRRLRKRAGMTQAQLADWLGVTRVHVTHLETGFRQAGPQTVRLLDIFAERLRSARPSTIPKQPKQRQQRRTE